MILVIIKCNLQLEIVLSEVTLLPELVKDPVSSTFTVRKGLMPLSLPMLESRDAVLCALIPAILTIATRCQGRLSSNPGGREKFKQG